MPDDQNSQKIQNMQNYLQKIATGKTTAHYKLPGMEDVELTEEELKAFLCQALPNRDNLYTKPLNEIVKIVLVGRDTQEDSDSKHDIREIIDFIRLKNNNLLINFIGFLCACSGSNIFAVAQVKIQETINDTSFLKGLGMHLKICHAKGWPGFDDYPSKIRDDESKLIRFVLDKINNEEFKEKYKNEIDALRAIIKHHYAITDDPGWWLQVNKIKEELSAVYEDNFFALEEGIVTEENESFRSFEQTMDKFKSCLIERAREASSPRGGWPFRYLSSRTPPASLSKNEKVVCDLLTNHRSSFIIAGEGRAERLHAFVCAFARAGQDDRDMTITMLAEFKGSCFSGFYSRITLSERAFYRINTVRQMLVKNKRDCIDVLSDSATIASDFQSIHGKNRVIDIIRQAGLRAGFVKDPAAYFNGSFRLLGKNIQAFKKALDPKNLIDSIAKEITERLKESSCKMYKDIAVSHLKQSGAGASAEQAASRWWECAEARQWWELVHKQLQELGFSGNNAIEVTDSCDVEDQGNTYDEHYYRITLNPKKVLAKYLFDSNYIKDLPLELFCEISGLINKADEAIDSNVLIKKIKEILQKENTNEYDKKFLIAMLKNVVEKDDVDYSSFGDTDINRLLTIQAGVNRHLYAFVERLISKNHEIEIPLLKVEEIDKLTKEELEESVFSMIMLKDKAKSQCAINLFENKWLIDKLMDQVIHQLPGSMDLLNKIINVIKDDEAKFGSILDKITGSKGALIKILDAPEDNQEHDLIGKLLQHKYSDPQGKDVTLLNVLLWRTYSDARKGGDEEVAKILLYFMTSNEDHKSSIIEQISELGSYGKLWDHICIKQGITDVFFSMDKSLLGKLPERGITYLLEKALEKNRADVFSKLASTRLFKKKNYNYLLKHARVRYDNNNGHIESCSMQLYSAFAKHVCDQFDVNRRLPEALQGGYVRGFFYWFLVICLVNTDGGDVANHRNQMLGHLIEISRKKYKIQLPNLDNFHNDNFGVAELDAFLSAAISLKDASKDPIDLFKDKVLCNRVVAHVIRLLPDSIDALSKILKKYDTGFSDANEVNIGNELLKKLIQKPYDSLKTILESDNLPTAIMNELLTHDKESNTRPYKSRKHSKPTLLARLLRHGEKESACKLLDFLSKEGNEQFMVEQFKKNGDAYSVFNLLSEKRFYDEDILNKIIEIIDAEKIGIFISASNSKKLLAKALQTENIAFFKKLANARLLDAAAYSYLATSIHDDIYRGDDHTTHTNPMPMYLAFAKHVDDCIARQLLHAQLLTLFRRTGQQHEEDQLQAGLATLSDGHIAGFLTNYMLIYLHDNSAEEDDKQALFDCLIEVIKKKYAPNNPAVDDLATRFAALSNINSKDCSAEDLEQCLSIISDLKEWSGGAVDLFNDEEMRNKFTCRLIKLFIEEEEEATKILDQCKQHDHLKDHFSKLVVDSYVFMINEFKSQLPSDLRVELKKRHASIAVLIYTPYVIPFVRELSGKGLITKEYRLRFYKEYRNICLSHSQYAQFLWGLIIPQISHKEYRDAKDKPKICNVDGMIIYDKSIVGYGPDPTVKGELRIPHGVEKIEEAVFRRRPDITSVIIPGSVSSIKELAFRSCKNLEIVDFQGRAGTESRSECGLCIERCAFSGCDNLSDIIIGEISPLAPPWQINKYAFYKSSKLGGGFFDSLDFDLTASSMQALINPAWQAEILRVVAKGPKWYSKSLVEIYVSALYRTRGSSPPKINFPNPFRSGCGLWIDLYNKLHVPWKDLELLKAKTDYRDFKQYFIDSILKVHSRPQLQHTAVSSDLFASPVSYPLGVKPAPVVPRRHPMSRFR